MGPPGPPVAAAPPCPSAAARSASGDRSTAHPTRHGHGPAREGPWAPSISALPPMPALEALQVPPAFAAGSASGEPGPVPWRPR
eukprot:14705450-Heterocapsa_arctica.AAC.1